MNNKKMPLYKYMMKNIQNLIEEEKLQEGDAIPTESQLSNLYGVSRVTVRRAITELVNEKTLYSVKGSGTYVSSRKFEHNLFKLQGFTEEMQPTSGSIQNEVIEFKLINPTEKIRNILEITSEDKVYNVKRIRHLNGEPLIIENAYLPFSLFPDLSIDAMTKSKYGYIKSKGYSIKNRFEEFIPKLPDNEQMEIFKIQEDEPLLELCAHSILSNGKIFEYSEVVYHPQKYKFTLELSR
ncbi:GntR family transcriptional regulator [Staphylococcus sp. GDX8P114P-2]|uniref:GntR family transcriptional regulator n=1 Tax=Staphylococcus TaxID=1279 RepID=UPI001AEBE4C1|nr:GntR family transcriptional regulator [Staphylococcus sp. GDX8P114P-2]